MMNRFAFELHRISTARPRVCALFPVLPLDLSHSFERYALLSTKGMPAISRAASSIYISCCDISCIEHLGVQALNSLSLKYLAFTIAISFRFLDFVKVDSHLFLDLDFHKLAQPTEYGVVTDYRSVFQETPKFYAATKASKPIRQPYPVLGQYRIQHLCQHDTNQDENKLVDCPPRLDTFKSEFFLFPFSYYRALCYSREEVHEFKNDYCNEQRQQALEKDRYETCQDASKDFCRVNVHFLLSMNEACH